MRKYIFNLFVLLYFISGCQRDNVRIITYDLKRTSYSEIIEAKGTIQAMNNFVVKSPRINVSGMTVAYLAEEGTHVKKGDTICILDSPELLLNHEMFSAELEKMEAEMKKLVADNASQMAVLKAQVQTNDAQIAISMLDSIQLNFAPAVKQQLLSLEMEKAMVEKKKLRKKYAAQELIDKSEISQLNSRIMMQKNRVQVFQDQINSLVLVSPGDGVVMHYESPVMHFLGQGVGTLGGKIKEKSSIYGNAPILQFPDTTEMQVAVEVPEADYKRIENGQKVMIAIEASANLATTGKIKRKTLAGQSSSENPAIKTYEVIVSVDSCHAKMKPGLSAWCRIIINEVADTVVVPSTAVFLHDSLKLVYVGQGSKFVPVVVETGLSNSSKSIITKGLQGNETIALMEPPYNLVKKVHTINVKPAVSTPRSLSKDSIPGISASPKMTLQ